MSKLILRSPRVKERKGRVNPFLIRVYTRKKLYGSKGVILHKIRVVDEASRKRCKEKINPFKGGDYGKAKRVEGDVRRK